MAARDNLQRVELQVLHRAHGLLGALDTSPAPPWPQTLLAKNEATGCIDVDGQHNGILPLGRNVRRLESHVLPSMLARYVPTQSISIAFASRRSINSPPCC